MVVTPGLFSQFAVGAVALYTLVTAAERANDRVLSLARYYDVPDEVIGMTVIAVGTSLPEISAHVVASVGILSGTLDYGITSAVVLGGNMGSSTTQQTLLFGLFVVAFGRLQLGDSVIASSYVPMIAALAVTLAVAVDGTISRLDGLVLLGAFVGYTYYGYTHRRRSYSVPETASTDVRRDIAVSLVALTLVLLSASLLLAVAQVVVGSLALGGSMVGVITLGIAAALPELSTVLDAVRRRAPNIALGTLLGSNVVNPLLGIGLGGAISTYRVPAAVVRWDLPFKLVVAVGLLVYVRVVTNRSLSRRDGAYLVVLYFVFVTVRLLFFPDQ
jgi:cation:H+ antiporter